MPIDLYGEKPLEALKGTVQRQAQLGKTVTEQMFSGVPKGRITPQLTRYKGQINDAIQAWGIDTLIKWNEMGAELRRSIEQDLEDARREAQQARVARDMETYKMALDRILFDKTMKQYADMLDQAAIGDIITAIVGGLGQIAAWYGAKRKEKKEMAGIEEKVKEYMEPIQSLIDRLSNQPELYVGYGGRPPTARPGL